VLPCKKQSVQSRLFAILSADLQAEFSWGFNYGFSDLGRGHHAALGMSLAVRINDATQLDS